MYFDKLVASPFHLQVQGKPEALRHHLQGCWLRRITNEHRLVYEVVDDTVRIITCRLC
ncbi:Txe/YoeB family addiction module toxin [Candidatus Venteria ishoeyi]|uniref:Txe/YoeB family addiction module toxin n=1 Tax=Candidatus Venteria ishoeyi TaxID=1899563 RepID=UPI00255CF3EB|nr:Txe/YoeB family addiction module toxin [Candidatus Venteria ishoeyi]